MNPSTMASTSGSSSPSGSSSSSPSDSEIRPQAGPLPTKQGEIGWSEVALTEAEEGRRNSSDGAPATTLLVPHPEERSSSDSANGSVESSAPAVPATAASASTASLATTATTPNSITKRKRLLGFLKPKKVPAFWGFRLTTFLAFFAQLLLVAGMIVAWYFTVTRVGHSNSSPNPNPNPGFNGPQTQNQNQDSQPVLGNGSSAIFIHVVFGVAVLVQLLFIERRVFRLRAERYSYLHPGEMLPSARRRAMTDPSIGLSPWNRPPLPTYAAALAQSGAGTGDAEDHLIAVAPPPAYGNTRGSTFLLSGFLSDNLRAQRPVSQITEASRRGSALSARSMTEQRRSRPVSYKTVDGDWEEAQDASRARILEDTLTTLERPSPAVIR